jgi:hypothetical protein
MTGKLYCASTIRQDQLMRYGTSLEIRRRDNDSYERLKESKACR